MVDSAYKESDEFYGLPVYTFEEVEQHVNIHEVVFAMTLGYSRMNENRKQKYEICKRKGYDVLTYISPQAQVYTQQVGEGSLILPGAYIGPYSTVGVCSVIRPGTVLAHHDVVGDFNWIADGCTFGGGVKVGNSCFIGLGTTVRNEVCIADYTLVGAHTYMGRNTEFEKVYYGVPGKIVEGKTSFEIIKNV